ncbi:hypothetical protein JHK86_003327 [Glycine max]|nr:hypothetical protein JHK86_003327 [Glycine max]
MSPVRTMTVAADEEAEYSFAVAYNGPQPAYDIPQAVPIAAGKIPVAAAVALSDALSLPVVQPLSKELKVPSSEPAVSPTSVIAFDRTTVSPTSGDCVRRRRHGSQRREQRKLVFGQFYSTKLERVITKPLELRASEFRFQRFEPTRLRVHVEFRLSIKEEQQHEAKERVKRENVIKKTKKGSCYCCLKGNRLTEKETCLVCDAKYCANCVLRAMGSMPEGRKCVGCIGLPIDEAKRGSLGKCSRLLKRLLNYLEVRQVMKAERFCEVNQLPPEYVCVNGNELTFEELVTLQSCANPPKNLKPGNYWYDKVSGFWGKEGPKPCRIISPHLNVGGPIKADSSNGNTQVFINGREITKVELRMLQREFSVLVTHIFGSMRMVHTKKKDRKIQNGVFGERPVHGIVHKLLLLGYTGSGTSTIFKQAKILYKSTPFSEDERENIKLTIQTNVYAYLGILFEGRERFEEESLGNLKKSHSSVLDTTGTSPKLGDKTIYSIGTRLKAFSDWLLKTMVSGKLDAIFPAATREYAPLIEELWDDAAIKAAYERRNEIELLPSVASYFLERISSMLKELLHPMGWLLVEFSFPRPAPEETVDTADLHDSLVRYQLITIHARGLAENCKWLEMFEDVELAIFCVSLSNYDQFSVDGNGCRTNKMISSRKLFEAIVIHPTFEQMDFLLILNKLDEFEEKIKRIPLTKCDWLSDFCPVISRHRCGINSNSINNSPSLSQLASYYIGVKFKRLYSSLTGRNLYVSLVKGLEPDSVVEALQYAKEILKWNEERPNFSLSDNNSMYSIEASSFSH